MKFGETRWRTWVQPASAGQAFRPQCAFVCVDLVEAVEPWLCAPHLHGDKFELVHVMRGNYACRVNQTEVRLRPGETLIVRPADVHEDTALSACTFLAVRFLLLGSHRYSSSFDIFAKGVSPEDLVLANTGSLLRSFHERVLAELQALTPLSASFLDALMLTLFLELVGRLPARLLSANLGAGQERTFEARLLELFQEHRDRNLSVGDMAKRLGMSVSSLERACKRELNVSVARALMNFRMQEALELVRHTRTPIKEVSELLGFANQNHFSSAFRKHFGHAPTNFRADVSG